MHAATTNYNLRIECMTEVELWRNYQIYKNWLKVVGDKRFVKATETELKSLKFGCKVKKQLKIILIILIIIKIIENILIKIFIKINK